MALTQPGKLNYRITLQQRAAGQDARGQAVGAWEDLATDPEVWAMPMPNKGQEYFAAAQLQAEGAMAWRIHFRTDITASMRATEGAAAYDIESVVHSPDRQWTDLYCVQGVKDGR